MRTIGIRVFSSPACSSGWANSIRLLNQYRLLLERDPQDVEVHIARGDLLLRQRLNDHAAAAFQEAIHCDPARPEPYRKLAIAYGDQQRYEEAAEALRSALQLNPLHVPTRYSLGLVYTRQARFADAAKELETAVEIDSTHADAYFELAGIHAATGRHQQAEASVRAALRQRPDFALGNTRLGQVLLALGRAGEGEAALRRAIALDPLEAESYHRLGQHLIRSHRTSEGERLLTLFERLQAVRDDIIRYRHLLRLYGEDAVAHYNLGVLYAQVGRPGEAAAEYRAALAINPATSKR